MDATVIFTEHGDALERLAARITRDREEARDVVADAFAALLASGPTDSDHAVPWLYVTVRNNAYNRVRRQAMATRRLAALASDSDPSFEPESAVRHDPSVRVLVATATAHLNERDRIAVSMRHMEQASYADIATALGTTIMQARVVVHRANGKLRKHVVASLSKHRNTKRAGSFVDTTARQGRVSDELAALLQVPAMLPSSQRIVHAVRDSWRKVETTAGRALVQFGELVTPGIAVVAMTTGAVVPAVPSVSAALPSAAPSVPVPTATPGSPSAPQEQQTVVAVQPLVRPSAPPSHHAEVAGVGLPAGSQVRFEDPDTPGRSTHYRDEDEGSLLSILGLPFAEIDPRELESFPEIDIRSLELATLANANGEPQALRWRIELAAPPSRSLSKVWLRWWYEDSDCFTIFEWPASTDPHVLTGCPILPLIGGLGGEGRGYMADAPHPGKLRVDGTVIEGTLPFKSLDRETRRMLHPGARLVRIVVGASCPDQSADPCPWDQAPDEGGYAYRIET